MRAGFPPIVSAGLAAVTYGIVRMDDPWLTTVPPIALILAFGLVTGIIAWRLECRHERQRMERHKRERANDKRQLERCFVAVLGNTPEAQATIKQAMALHEARLSAKADLGTFTGNLRIKATGPPRPE